MQCESQLKSKNRLEIYFFNFGSRLWWNACCGLVTFPFILGIFIILQLHYCTQMTTLYSEKKKLTHEHFTRSHSVNYLSLVVTFNQHLNKFTEFKSICCLDDENAKHLITSILALSRFV